jgi:uncharacterized membrane protein
MTGLAYVATLVSGLVAGIFFPFSTFAMAGLRRLEPARRESLRCSRSTVWP